MKNNICKLLAVAALIGGAGLKTFADGLLIPAYLPLSDTASWNILREGAALIKSGKSHSYNEYIVTVTGPNNGPFTNPTDWLTASNLWTPIRNNGGLIFGYVHTCQTPTSPIFRALLLVEADITSWVKNYPNIDGIWIDEFYPRYELTDNSIVVTNAGLQYAYANFPNGYSSAPTNYSYLNTTPAAINQTINGAVQVDPSGGYYDQLTKWIRNHYPRLKILGNAGGQFYSNQIKYIDLVDICCSFEQTYAYAANAPVNDWANLVQQTVTTNADQAALILSNTSDLTGALNQAISHGYNYFYTTSGSPEGNTYGTLPSYFTSEVIYLSNLK